VRCGDWVLRPHGWGKLILTRACPRTGSAWNSTGRPQETRSLKHRSDGAIRIVPVPPVLVMLLRQHPRDHGTTPDGRLFRGTRGGILSESLYGRTWHAARAAALGPDLAATGLVRRPYDLRHAALSLWLNASTSPAEVAALAGNSVHGRPRQPADRARPPRRAPITVGDSKRSPDRPSPLTLSAICP
jgi:integrase